MPDEVAWEESGLGHGLFTYCWSLRPAADQPPLGGVVAVGVRPDNSFGPSLEVARGPFGCSLLTYGRQNPVFFRDYELNVCEVDIPVYNDPDYRILRSSEDIWTEAFQARDRFRAASAALHPKVRVEKYISSDAEMRESIRENLDSPRRTPA